MNDKACIHHWLIAPPRGPESLGRCKKCGVMRWFQNSLDATEAELNHAVMMAARSKEPEPVGRIVWWG